MTVSKLSQIGASGSNFTSGDFLAAVQSGTTDVLFSLAQTQFGIIGGIGGTTVTTSQPVINLAQTWNAGGVAFTGLLFNFTNTASAVGSVLFDFQLGGTSLINFNLASTTLKINDGGVGGFAGITFLHGGADEVTINNRSNGTMVFYGNSSGSAPLSTTARTGVCNISFDSTALVGFTSGNVLQANDTILARDAAGILAQRNSTNAQTFRVYNTFTDASNYERGVFDWGTTSNVLTIDVQVLGTGTQRVISIKHLDSATGAGTATFAATNCPATTLTSPYTWVKVTSSDGSVVYMPAWK